MPGFDQTIQPPGVGRTLAGRYRLVAPIARGGMAEVWEGYDEVLSRPVAVKVLQAHLAADGVFLERFRREAITAARLAHPGITATFDTGLDQGTAFIVMELVRGRNLRQVLDDRGRLEPWQAVTIARQVADALAYAHQAGLVHRDIKPANVLIVEEEWGGLRVKVTDFGIAKAGLGSGADLTRTGMVLGTPKYLSPEQIRGGDPDARADLYSLGVVLYEMLVGGPPFVGETDMATALAHLSDKAPRPSSSVRHIPGSLDRIVGDLLAKAPERRIPSAAELRARLDGLGPMGPADPGRSGGGRPDGGRGEAGRRGRRRSDGGPPSPGHPPIPPMPYRAPQPPAPPAWVPGAAPGWEPDAPAARSGSPVVPPSSAPPAGAVPLNGATARDATMGGYTGAPGGGGPIPGAATPTAGRGGGGFSAPPPPPPAPGAGRSGPDEATAAVTIGDLAGSGDPGRGRQAAAAGFESAPTTFIGASDGPGPAPTTSMGAYTGRPGPAPTTALPGYGPGPSTDQFDAAPPPPPRRHRRSERNAGLVVLGLVVIGAIVAAGLLAGGHHRSGSAAPGGSSGGSGSAVGIASVGVFMVNGRPPDNPRQTPLTFDGNPATSWSTAVYSNPTFGNLYPGIGLEISLGRHTTVHSLTVTSPSQGWSASAYVSSAAVPSPSPISAWGAATDSKSNVAGSTTLSLGGHGASYVLLWITNLGPANQVKIAELGVK